MAKRSKYILRFIVFPFFLLAIAATATYYLTNYLNRPGFVRFPAFGIDIPVNYSIHGIDVSHYQANIDWLEVKSMQVNNIKIGFAYIKATEGLGSVDESFRRNWFNVKKAGLARGAYHFFNSAKSGKAQAENYIEMVVLNKGDLPPVLDIEQTNGASITDIQQRAKDWLDIVQKHYNVKPVIYTNIDFYENFLAKKFDDYPLWVAHYLSKEKPAIGRNWILWQHNEKGHVNGINAFVDFNIFYGDSTEFKKILMK